eukprot:Amastigsp_a686433_48.p3 type:complete len:117 gc:universal Amastigsp_a686433_48:436-786(+)
MRRGCGRLRAQRQTMFSPNRASSHPSCERSRPSWASSFVQMRSRARRRFCQPLTRPQSARRSSRESPRLWARAAATGARDGVSRSPCSTSATRPSTTRASPSPSRWARALSDSLSL